jgi:glycosyltransferase involved in cell wall biosynthesis
MSNEPSPAAATVGPSEILFVLGQFEIGGTERHVLSVVRALVKTGWRVSVYCLAGDGPLRVAFEESGATVVLPPVNAGRERKSLVARIARLAVVVVHLFAVLVRRRGAIVHIFLPSAYVLAGPLVLLARSPIRIMSRRSLNAYRISRPLVWRLEQYLHRGMTAILGNSRSVVRELRDEEHVPVKRLGLIYNGVQSLPDLQLRQKHRARLELTPSTLVFVIVANLIPYKGHHDLIKALAIAAPNLSADWRLLAVGEDYGISDELRDLARKLGIENKVSFLGVRNDVSDILVAGDIGLLCSHEEGFSNAILEGMAACLPMIVTNVGGNPDAVLHDETGIVVPPHDPQRLAEALIRLAGDAELRKRLGTAARRRVEEHFSLDQVITSYELLYRTLLAGGLPRDVPQLCVGDGIIRP